ncbi:hypothetical protein BKH03_00450 [Actinomyces naeslundii]|nr:hypothetical protein BKH03_00450 [Actinomyces naeslundii]
MDCEDWDDDGDMDEDMALLVRHEEVRDAQAGDVQRMDGLGHSPVVPHPRQLRPPPILSAGVRQATRTERSPPLTREMSLPVNPPTDRPVSLRAPLDTSYSPQHDCAH